MAHPTAADSSAGSAQASVGARAPGQRDVVMQEARTGASGSSPSQLPPPPVAVHTNEEPHPIPRLVLPRRHLRVSGHGSKLRKGSAGRLAGAWSSIPTNTEQGVRKSRGVRGRGGRREGCESSLLRWVGARCRRGQARGTGTQRSEVWLCRHWGLRAAVLSQRFVPAGARQDREGAGGV